MNKKSTKWVLGHLVTTHDTSGDYDLMMAETPPMVQGPPPHLHKSYKEAFIILEGEMEFFVNGESKLLKAGESIDIPPKTLHTFNNRSDQSCKWINIHSPKGFRAFFESLGVPSEEQNAQQRSLTPELIQRVIKTAGDFDMHIEV